MSQRPARTTHKSIFEIGNVIKNAPDSVKELIYEYADDYTKWWKVADNIDDIIKQSAQFQNDYTQSMEVVETSVSFSTTSYYTDNGNYLNISDWVWRRQQNTDKFSFDSDAEREWASILQDLSRCNGTTKVKLAHKQPNQLALWEAQSPEKEIYIWGKNYLGNSDIKFPYYMGAIHSSYPDFIMKDKFGRIHIFEVKSVNKSANFNFDNNIYQKKIAELKAAYKQASLLTGQIFYMPVIENDVRNIFQYIGGTEHTISKEQFLTFVKTEPL